MSIAPVEDQAASFAVPAPIITDRDVSALEFRLYALLGAMDDAGDPAPPMSAIAVLLGVSVPTAWRAVTGLDASGWITRTRRPPGATLTQVHRVRLTKAELKARAAERKAVARAQQRAKAVTARASTARSRAV